ncbi:preprotein translocase subunit SecG [Paracoccaceae bacterium GXU_MW_L88]
MQNIILIIHLILTLCLIGVVLLQRSEGGGLGMGSSSAGGGVMSGRQAASALTRLTWIFGIGFFCTSVTLTILAATGSNGGSIIDQGASTPAETPIGGGSESDLLTPPPLGDTTAPAEETPATGADTVAPPPAVEDAPAAPEAPATEAAPAADDAAAPATDDAAAPAPGETTTN